MEINFNHISNAFYQNIYPPMGRLGQHIVQVLNATSKLAVSHPIAGSITANIILCETGIKIARLVGEIFNAYIPYEVASPTDKAIRCASIMTGLFVYLFTANYFFITTLNIPLTPIIATSLAVVTNSLYMWARTTYNS